MIRLHGVDYRGSVCDGPGIRSVIFFQGCMRRCPGCHNPTTWDLDGGYDIEETSLLSELDRCSPTKRVTISGGEPLLQQDAVEMLVGLLKQEGYDVALYTGFAKQEIRPTILAMLDYVKTGEYVEALHTTVIPYVGSKNQIFEALKH